MRRQIGGRDWIGCCGPTSRRQPSIWMSELWRFQEEETWYYKIWIQEKRLTGSVILVMRVGQYVSVAEHTILSSFMNDATRLCWMRAVRFGIQLQVCDQCDQVCRQIDDYLLLSISYIPSSDFAVLSPVLTLLRNKAIVVCCLAWLQDSEKSEHMKYVLVTTPKTADYHHTNNGASDTVIISIPGQQQQ